ncbi:unnamed protein product [Rotaria socialis]|nr:unnamed protein product [Rotaria socialis]
MGPEQLKPYFDFSTIDKNRVNGYCKLCNQNYKDKCGIFSNFLKHLKRKHVPEYEKLFFDQVEDSPEVVNGSDHRSTIELSSSNTKQNRINISIAKYLIIKCNLPLNLVENSAFREFMKECNVKWNPISSKKLKHDGISFFADKMKTNLHATLNGVKFVTLTVDGWSDRRGRSFIGVTCHFINYKCESQAFLIDFVRLKGPHTGENIHRTTEFILDRYNLKEKVYKIVTDNASSMIKAYKFGLPVDDEVYDDDSNKIKSNSSANSGCDDNDDDIDINDLEFMNIAFADDYEDIENPSDLRLSCFIHSLQLSVRDGLKNAPYVPKLLKKCQTLAKFSHKSSKVAELLEELNKHIHKMTITRWNSEFLLIKSILSIGRTDLETITSAMDNPIKFSDNDFIALEELIDILQPFYDVSIKCQAETALTASLVVPSIVHLISHLRDIKPDISLCLKLVQQLEESIKTRFSGIINRLNLVDVADNSAYYDPIYFIVAVLDPSFKFLWIHDLNLPVPLENRLKQHIIELIINEMEKDLPTSTIEPMKINFSSKSTLSSSFTTTTPPRKRRKLFNYDDNIINDSNASSTLDPAVELDAFLNDPVRSNFSNYWFHSQLKILKNLVVRIFSVQASSAPIERVFSHAGLILSSRRTNMNETLFRDLVLLRVNQNLL